MPRQPGEPGASARWPLAALLKTLLHSEFFKHPALWLHRWTGIAVALFLISCATTGAVLAFYHPLYKLTASWRQVDQLPGQMLLSPEDLIRAAEIAAPEAAFNRLELKLAPDEARVFFPSPRGEKALDFDEIALNPYTGQEVYRGTFGDITEGIHQLLPFIFELHYSLALGEWGFLILGIVALVWTVNCFLGLWLTFPRFRRGWLTYWSKAWRLPAKPSLNLKFNFHFHRAVGLWAWCFLLIFAWSSVGFNLPAVYRSVMTAAGATDVFASLPKSAGPENPAHDWIARLFQARAIAKEHGKQQGYEVIEESALSYRSNADAFEYRFRSSIDLPTTGSQSRLFFDRVSGSVVGYKSGRGGPNANGLKEWLVALHIAAIGGLAYQIFVMFFGLIVTWLSLTGLLIWWQKRRIKQRKFRVLRSR